MHKIPTFELASISSPVTFNFYVNKPLGGWATCTVNDRTGELLIMSDWGDWSYRWNVASIGTSLRQRLAGPHIPHRRMTLMEFITDRHDFNYLARKLGGKEESEEFDGEATVAALRRQLCQNRLAQGRENRRPHPEDFLYMDPEERAETKIEESFRFAELRWWSGSEEPLTRGIARAIWDALDELEHCRDEHVFWERIWNVNGISWVSEMPHEYAVHRHSMAFDILENGILPALATEATKWLDARTPAPPPISWAGDLAVRRSRERGIGGVL